MVWLALGVVLWSCTHLLRGLAPSIRHAIIARLGPGPYKGLFSLTILASIGLMVAGWRAGTPGIVHLPPAWGRSGALVLMFVALVLFAASGVPSNLKRVIRHPQLTGVAVWAFAHLLANGDGASVTLFGGLGVWAVVEMVAINRREGAWQKPEPVPLSAEAKPIIGAAVAYAVLLFAHPYLFGINPLG